MTGNLIFGQALVSDIDSVNIMATNNISHINDGNSVNYTNVSNVTTSELLGNQHNSNDFGNNIDNEENESNDNNNIEFSNNNNNSNNSNGNSTNQMHINSISSHSNHSPKIHSKSKKHKSKSKHKSSKSNKHKTSKNKTKRHNSNDSNETDSIYYYNNNETSNNNGNNNNSDETNIKYSIKSKSKSKSKSKKSKLKESKSPFKKLKKLETTNNDMILNSPNRHYIDSISNHNSNNSNSNININISINNHNHSHHTISHHKLHANGNNSFDSHSNHSTKMKKHNTKTSINNNDNDNNSNTNSNTNDYSGRILNASSITSLPTTDDQPPPAKTKHGRTKQKEELDRQNVNWERYKNMFIKWVVDLKNEGHDVDCFYFEHGKGVFCRVCIAAEKPGVFVQKGAYELARRCLTKHLSREKHTSAIEKLTEEGTLESVLAACAGDAPPSPHLSQHLSTPPNVAAAKAEHSQQHQEQQQEPQQQPSQRNLSNCSVSMNSNGKNSNKEEFEDSRSITNTKMRDGMEEKLTTLNTNRRQLGTVSTTTNHLSFNLNLTNLGIKREKDHKKDEKYSNKNEMSGDFSNSNSNNNNSSDRKKSKKRHKSSKNGKKKTKREKKYSNNDKNSDDSKVTNGNTSEESRDDVNDKMAIMRQDMGTDTLSRFVMRNIGSHSKTITANYSAASQTNETTTVTTIDSHPSSSNTTSAFSGHVAPTNSSFGTNSNNRMHLSEFDATGANASDPDSSSYLGALSSNAGVAVAASAITPGLHPPLLNLSQTMAQHATVSQSLGFEHNSNNNSMNHGLSGPITMHRAHTAQATVSISGAVTGRISEQLQNQQQREQASHSATMSAHEAESTPQIEHTPQATPITPFGPHLSAASHPTPPTAASTSTTIVNVSNAAFPVQMRFVYVYMLFMYV